MEWYLFTIIIIINNNNKNKNIIIEASYPIYFVLSLFTYLLLVETNELLSRLGFLPGQSYIAKIIISSSCD